MIRSSSLQKRNLNFLKDIPGEVIGAVNTVRAAGFIVYIVGGAVRDLLLGARPTDFDLITDASPEQLMTLFPSSRIRGSLFKYVLLTVNRCQIEIATFRGVCRATSKLSEGWTTAILADDASHRDFSVNAMYYDPISSLLYDFHKGLQDLRHKLLRCINRPNDVLKQDPMVALRAIRLSCRLDFVIDEVLQVEMPKVAALFDQTSPNRVVAEFMNQLVSGRSAECLTDLCHYGLHHAIMPRLADDLAAPFQRNFVKRALTIVDRNVMDGVFVSACFVFAILLWPQYREQHAMNNSHIYEAAGVVFDSLGKCLSLRHTLGKEIRAIWATQPLFEVGHQGNPTLVMSLPNFRAGYNFFMLRCNLGEVDRTVGLWWEEFVTRSQK